jgi:hypothetical protein
VKEKEKKRKEAGNGQNHPVMQSSLATVKRHTCPKLSELPIMQW